MQDVGIESVISMLSESELKTYAEPLPAAMEAAFGPGSYVNIDAKAPGAQSQILSTIKSARDAGKKVLVHCWGGERGEPKKYLCRAHIRVAQKATKASCMLMHWAVNSVLLCLCTC